MLTPGFIAAHSHRLEDLTDLAVQLLARYPLAPLEEDVVLVQSNGIAQWLKQAIASHTGIATMLEVTLPARLVWRVYRAVLGAEIPRQSPFDKSRLRWRLMRLLPESMAKDPIFSALKAYVAHDPDQRKLFQLSDKLADLFDQYQVYRADWLDAWTQGDWVLIHREQRTPLAPEFQWQAALWQALVNDIGAEQICSNRAALHQQFIAEATKLTAQGKRPAGIPPRIMVFGISSLPRQTLEVLHAIKGICQIVLCVHNPCKYHWADIVDGRELLNQYAKPRFQAKPSAEVKPYFAASQAELHQVAQPLLASWGKQGRDYIRLLDEFDETAHKATHFTELRFDLFDEAATDTLLSQIQSDILHLRPLSETQAQWSAPHHSDHSVVFHRCHSPQREVEVLHDHLLAAFAADPSLQPRDIMVMVPDINSYAPYIDAVFGRLGKDDKRFIPYTIADQGLRQRAPILQALERVLTAPQQRFSHSDIFDLLHVPAIQQRFAVTPEQVQRLQEWSHAAGARWGLHASHRHSLGLEFPYNENSWQFALDRMLYGFAAGNIELNQQASATQFWQTLEPYPEVVGLDAQAVGALSSLIHLLQHAWQTFAVSQSPAIWHNTLMMLLDQLFTPTNESEVVLLTKLRDALDEWLSSTQEAEFTAALRYNIVLDVWLSAVDEPNLQQRFMAGSVNFATLMPMRAIPFKRICLLGMNDTEYPRTTQKADFDLMARHYRPGDRSRREDDRYLFLEAMLSAREQFYVSWVGMSAQDNSELPPSVLVGQLHDHLNAGWGAHCAAALTVTHRLQPFARCYYTETSEHFFSYAKEWLSVQQTPEPIGAAAPAVDPAIPVLADFIAEAAFSLTDLSLLLREPAQLLARRRLGVFLEAVEQTSSDTEAFIVDGLQAWHVKDVLLAGIMHLTDNATPEGINLALDSQITRLRRQGHLPYQHGADAVLEQSKASVLAIYQCYLRYYPGAASKIPPKRHQLSYQINGLSYFLEEELTGLYQQDTQQYLQLELKVSKVAECKPRSVQYTWRNIVLSYLKHLFANAVLSESVTTVIIGEDGVITLAPLAAEPQQAQQLAKETLTHLMQNVSVALTTPLPTALVLAEAWFKRYSKDTFSSPVTSSATADAAAESSLLAQRQAVFLTQLCTGDEYQDGVLKKLPYLARYYSDGEQLLQQGFIAWSERLYQPFFDFIRAASVQAVSEEPV